jgi:hypothetical protein
MCAQRRMFSLQVVDTDAFLEMPASTQNLYFHLGMRADDDGFVSNPKKIMKIINGHEDDLKILFSKRFILGFDSGIIVIKHWRMHNYIAKDRYRETVYVEEKSKLQIKDNGSYTDCIQSVDSGKVRIGKDSKGKDKIDKKKNAYRDNVFLTETEFNTLLEKYSKEFVEKCLDKLDSYKLSSGKKYKSDYGAMNTWVIDSIKEKNPSLVDNDKKLRNNGKHQTRESWIKREMERFERTIAGHIDYYSKELKDEKYQLSLKKLLEKNKLAEDWQSDSGRLEARILKRFFKDGFFIKDNEKYVINPDLESYKTNARKRIENEILQEGK